MQGNCAARWSAACASTPNSMSAAPTSAPKYAAEVKRYTDTQTAYAEYLLRGKFTVLDTSPLPYYIKRGEFYSEDGTKVLRILYNAAKETTETVCGVSLRPDEMRFDIYDRESYEKEMNP
mgnify:CR=1 FL=1